MFSVPDQRWTRTLRLERKIRLLWTTIALSLSHVERVKGSRAVVANISGRRRSGRGETGSSFSLVTSDLMMTNRETVIKNDLVLHTEDTDITSGRQATVVTTRDGSSEVVVVTRDNSDVKKTRDGPTTSLAADLDSCFLQSMVGITEEQIVDQSR